MQEVTVENNGEVLLRFALAYGFRNIQNIVQRIKRKKLTYDFVEIMACPSGNLNECLLTELSSTLSCAACNVLFFCCRVSERGRPNTSRRKHGISKRVSWACSRHLQWSWGWAAVEQWHCWETLHWVVGRSRVWKGDQAIAHNLQGNRKTKQSFDYKMVISFSFLHSHTLLIVNVDLC